jgi:hypothetical protein
VGQIEAGSPHLLGFLFLFWQPSSSFFSPNLCNHTHDQVKDRNIGTCSLRFPLVVLFQGTAPSFGTRFSLDALMIFCICMMRLRTMKENLRGNSPKRRRHLLGHFFCLRSIVVCITRAAKMAPDEHQRGIEQQKQYQE